MFSLLWTWDLHLYCLNKQWNTYLWKASHHIQHLLMSPAISTNAFCSFCFYRLCEWSPETASTASKAFPRTEENMTSNQCDKLCMTSHKYLQCLKYSPKDSDECKYEHLNTQKRWQSHWTYSFTCWKLHGLSLFTIL